MPILPEEEEDNNPNNKKIYLLCQLVTFLLASLMQREEEWQSWGQPFLLSLFTAQFTSQDEAQRVLAVYEKQFLPLIGQQCFLWVGQEEDEDYEVISHAEEKMLEVLNTLSTLHDPPQAQVVAGGGGSGGGGAGEGSAEGVEVVGGLEDMVESFLQRYYDFLRSSPSSSSTTTTSSSSSSSHCCYDARARLIVKRICSLTKGLAKCDHHTIESTHLLDKLGPRKSFLEGMNTSIAAIPRDSLVVPRRALKVALVALSGGAMVGVAGMIAAPSIIATMVPMVMTATSFLQVSLALETIAAAGFTFSSFSSTTFLPMILPTLFTSYGTSVAAETMMLRTAPIDEFALHAMFNPNAVVALPRDKQGSGGVASQPHGRQGSVAIFISGHIPQPYDCQHDREIWGADSSSLLPGQEDNDHHDDEEEEKKKKCKGDVWQQVAAVLVERTTQLLPTMTNTHSTPVVDTTPSHIASSESKEMVVEEEVEEEEVVKDVEDGWAALQVHCRPGWWREVLPTDEAYLLRWESKLLSRLQDSFYQMVADKVYGEVYAKVYSQVMQFTPIPSIKGAMSLPLTVVKNIESLKDPWALIMDRARQAGYLLAKALLAEKGQPPPPPAPAAPPATASASATTGESSSSLFRPVLLIGYGMGARVIFHCLEALSELPHAQGCGIVEHAVLMGTPVSNTPSDWQKARHVVAGRLVNVYSTTDYLLALLYRSKLMQWGIAGLGPYISPNTAVQYYTMSMSMAMTMTREGTD
eukprot:scaffold1190_cov187-Ochromonas_danica.AAC.35